MSSALVICIFVAMGLHSRSNLWENPLIRGKTRVREKAIRTSSSHFGSQNSGTVLKKDSLREVSNLHPFIPSWWLRCNGGHGI